jgi:hypothetical protein
VTTAGMTERIAEASPRLKARIAGVFNLPAILTGVFASFIVHGRLGFVAELIAGACNIAVTLLLIGALEWHPQGVDIGLISLGFYCLLIGYLIFRSNFLPRILGALMAFAGLAWLILLSPPLANNLSPYNVAAGILGQGSLTLWLLVMGVNVQRWKEGPAERGTAIISAPCTLIQALAKEKM